MMPQEALQRLGLAAMPGTRPVLAAAYASALQAAHGRLRFPPPGVPRDVLVRELQLLDEARNVLVFNVNCSFPMTTIRKSSLS